MCSLWLREKLKASVAGQIMFDEPLSKHTSWKVGGPAEILFLPETIDDLRTAVLLAEKNDVPVSVLGNGTNVLVSDRGVPGLTVILKQIRCHKVSDGSITAEAGILLPELSRIAQQHNLTGLEFAVGIPASVGGAVASNAGAHGRSMQDIVHSVSAMGYDGSILTFSGRELGFNYRSSIFKESGFIVLQAHFNLETISGTAIQEKMRHYLDMRRKTQPVGYPTAGSVFVNPAAAPAGYLIEMAGCKGLREGGAEVSTKHANFIVNIGNATAGDILCLIRQVQQRVNDMFNIRLETEIRFFGEVP